MELENAMISSSSSSSAGSREYKVVMLGAGGVGKSGKFQQQYFGREGANWERKVHRRRTPFNEGVSFPFLLHMAWIKDYSSWLGQ